MISRAGPFVVCKSINGTLDISLKCLDNVACGWEWGWRDEARGAEMPIIQFRVGKLMVLYLATWKWGFEFWVLGFWFMPHIGKAWWEK